MSKITLDNIDFKNIKLPFQPHVLSGILKLQGDSMMNFHGLNNLVKSDQSITALILKIANSSFYFRGNEVTTLEQAIGIIGFQTVISFSIAASIKNAYASANYSKFRKFVWQHSVVCGIVSKNLAVRLHLDQYKEEAFIGGAIHDIGKVILNSLDRKLFITVLHEALDANAPFFAIESKYFGFNHNELGARCIEFWNLPEVYKIIAMHHNDPELVVGTLTNENEKILLLLVAYGDILAKKYKYGQLTEQDLSGEARIAQKLGLTNEDRNYYDNQFLDEMKGDAFYQFFITLL
ncbi:MAG: HDOD domain-containing protein [Spirochaetia bacterium]|nr:HDOD domain-containing protein [Spirochaetia bacterium]